MIDDVKLSAAFRWFILLETAISMGELPDFQPENRLRGMIQVWKPRWLALLCRALRAPGCCGSASAGMLEEFLEENGGHPWKSNDQNDSMTIRSMTP